MNPLWTVIVSLILGLSAALARAQGPPPTLLVSLNLDAHPPAEITRWSSGQVNAVFTIYATGIIDTAATLRVTIKQGDVPIATTDSDVDIHLGVKCLAGRNLVRFSEIKVGDGFDRFKAQLLTTNRLPAGRYQFCVSILDRAKRPFSFYGAAEVCASFGVNVVQPPRLRFPVNNAVLYPGQRKRFDWIPVSTATGNVRYHFRLVTVYPGQTPTNAFLGNRALYETTTSTPSLLWPNILFSSQPGCYAWGVQGTDRDGYPLGDPDGWSDLFVFTVLEPQQATGPNAGFGAETLNADTATFERIPSDASTFSRISGGERFRGSPSGGAVGTKVRPDSLDRLDSTAGPAAGKQSAGESGETENRRLLFENTTKKGEREITFGPEVVRYQDIVFHDTLLESKEPIFAEFFEDTVGITITGKKKLKYGTKWVGSIVNEGESYVLFVRRGDIIIGNITRDGVLYQVRYFGGGVHKLIQIDQSKFKGEGDPVVPDSPDGNAPWSDFPDTDPPDRIDVMVLYTPGARDAARGALGIEAEILLAVEETNFAYVQSGMCHRLELVSIVGTSYRESGDLGKDLSWLENNAGVAALRDQEFADIVVMVVENGNFNGLANIMAYPDHSAEAFAFGVVQRLPATGNYTFGHETGHILGCHHDCQTDEAGRPMYRYAHGYRDTAGKKGTIMADQVPGYRRIPLFSNPNLAGAGTVTIGTMAGECPSCEACLMEKTAGIVANFRHGPEGAADVWMKDTWNDVGAEPNPDDSTHYLWSAPWVETLRDTGVSLDPRHRIPVRGQPRWIAATLRNGGRDTAFGVLQLFYRNASLSAEWDSSWTLLSATPEYLLPDTVQTFAVRWDAVPNYEDYSIVGKWISASDTMHTPETDDLIRNARQNNNIVWKNEHILDVAPSTSTRADATFRGVANSTLEILCSPSTLSKQSFPQEAGSVRVEFDAETATLLGSGGKKAGGDRDRDGRGDSGSVQGGEQSGEREWTIHGGSGENRLTFHLPAGVSGQDGRVSLFFEAREASSPARYPVHVVQKSADGTVIGGISYLLVYADDEGNKWQRPDSVPGIEPNAAVNTVLSVFPISAQAAESRALENRDSEHPFFLTGSASIFAEGYRGSDLNVKQSPVFGRVVLAPTLRFGNQFALPLNLAFSISSGTGPERSFLQTLADPANSFGLALTFGQVGIKVGSHTPDLSGLVGSNVQLFGLGVDVRAGEFRVVLSGGLSQSEISGGGGQEGNYARIMGVGKFSLETEGARAGLNLLYVSDDKGSVENSIVEKRFRTFQGGGIVRTIDWTEPPEDGTSASLNGEDLFVVNADTVTVTQGSAATTLHRVAEGEEWVGNPFTPLPQRNVVATLSAAFPISEAVSLEGEVGGSIFTRDTRAETFGENSAVLQNDILSLLNRIYPLTVSTSVDVAATFRVNVNKEISRKKKVWDLAADAAYIGGGYRSLALPYLRGDRLTVSLSPNVELLRGKLLLSGMLEWNRDNVAGYEPATNNELHVSADAAWQITELLKLDAGYGGVWQYKPSDSLLPGIASGFHQLRLTPSCRIASGAAHHFLLATAAIVQRNERSFLLGGPGVAVSSTLQMFSVLYAISLAAVPLTGDVELAFTQDMIPVHTFLLPASSQSGTVGVGYSFLQERMPCRLYCTLLFSSLNWDSPSASERQTLIGAHVDWKATSRLRFSARGEINGNAVPLETRGRLGMEWRW